MGMFMEKMRSRLLVSHVGTILVVMPGVFCRLRAPEPGLLVRTDGTIARTMVLMKTPRGGHIEKKPTP